MAAQSTTALAVPPMSQSSVGADMAQLCLDFSERLTEGADTPPNAIYDAQDTAADDDLEGSPSIIDSVLGDPNGKVLEATHDQYIRFALSLLLTCAEDLFEADSILARTDAAIEDIQYARTLKAETTLWLCDKTASLFSFHECAQLLEEELFTQSNGQNAMHGLADNRAQLAQWILDDPAAALRSLSQFGNPPRKRREANREDVQMPTRHSRRERMTH